MEWFRNLKLFNKLLVSFGAVVLIMAALGIIALSKLSVIDANSKELAENWMPSIEIINQLDTPLSVFRRNEIQFVLSKTQEDFDHYQGEMEKAKIDLLAKQKAYEPMVSDDVENALYEKFKNQLAEYFKEHEKINNLCRSGKNDEALVLLRGSSSQAYEAAISTIDADIKLNHDGGVAEAKAADETYRSSRIIVFSFLFLGIAVAIGIAFFVGKQITKPVLLISERVKQLNGLCVTNLGNGLEALARGDTKYEVVTGTPFLEIGTKDEVGALSRDIDGIIKQTRASVASFDKSRGILKNVVEEIDGLIVNAKDGKLNARGDANNYQGVYKELINGFNDTLAAIVEPINESSEVLAVMANNDFTVRMTGNYKGDYQAIKNSVNSLGDSLTNVFHQVSEAVSATASASNEISSSTEEMAAGAQEQTQQATEVATAVEQMTKTILDTTNNANAAAGLAKHAGDTARAGGEVVEQTVAGMNRIADVVQQSAETVEALGKSSDQIGEIVQVIDDIADQTNLLALNAAIEAARAGEQGRGFAVVADEVRKLAERTTKATKEIATMIKQIQKDTVGAVESMSLGKREVESGKQLAAKAGDSLKEIISGATKVVDTITQVAAASEEQSSASEQISKNIEAISSVTQESAAGTQQIARAAEDLNRLTQNLQDIVNQFKISNIGALHGENQLQHSARKSLSGGNRRISA
jgi:methyl-accepting chemotaxis protein